MSEPLVLWEARIRVKEVMNGGDHFRTVVFDIIGTGEPQEGVLVFDERNDFPYQAGQVLEVSMRLVEEN